MEVAIKQREIDFKGKLLYFESKKIYVLGVSCKYPREGRIRKMKKQLRLATLCLAVGMMITGCCDDEAAKSTTAAASTDTAANSNDKEGSSMDMNKMGGDEKSSDKNEKTDDKEGSDGGMDMSEEEGDGHGHGHEMEMAENIRGEFKFATPLTAKKNEKLSILLTNADNGKPIKEFEAEHTKLMHLIVVSKDLSYFDHIHPEYLGFGKFEITTQVPSGGDYLFIADTVPKDQGKSTLKNWMFAEGPEPAPVPLTVDKSLTKVVEGKEITLSFDKELKAETDLKLTFHIADAATKKPIEDLEPYLGAVGHTVIIDQNAEEYLHVHPSDEEARGPNAVFETKFPYKGKYKIWNQFQHQGKVITVSYVVDVK